MKANNILETIGNTPHVRLNKLFAPEHEVWIKLERSNPGASIKDRIALAMVEAAEAKGELSPESVIIEGTSGNTGIGLALVAAVKGYRLILTMPESMSIERRRYLKSLGAEIVLTPKENGMPGAVAKAEELAKETANSWIPSQFDNLANPEIHRQTTAKEIIADFPEGLDVLITGVGTGGHITGCADTLKEKWPDFKVFAVEPEESPVINGGDPGPHGIQGIGAGFIPNVFNTKILDGAIKVNTATAKDYARQAALTEGIFLGISSGASLAAVAKYLESAKTPQKIITFCYDTGERYLSVEDLFV